MKINVLYVCDNISLDSSWKEKCFRKKCCRENQNTFYVQQRFSENRALYEIMWENVAEPQMAQVTM